MDRQGSIEPALAAVSGGSGGYLAALLGLQLFAHIAGVPTSTFANVVLLSAGALAGAYWSARSLGR